MYDDPAATRNGTFAGTVILSAVLLFLPGCSGCKRSSSATNSGAPQTASPPVVDSPVEQQPAESKPDEPPPVASKPDSESEGPPDHSTDVRQNRSSSSSPKSTSKSTVSHNDGGSNAVSERTGRTEGAEAAGVSTDGRETSPKLNTPADALEYAKQLRRSSAETEARGDVSKAFEITAEAWNALRGFQHDGECRKVSNQLAIELESLGNRVNAKVAPEATSTKRLVEK